MTREGRNLKNNAQRGVPRCVEREWESGVLLQIAIDTVGGAYP